MAKKPEFYVEYNHNNSGGSWWLKDDDWKKLEAAGWEVDWFADRKDVSWYTNGRFLGALASSAKKTGVKSLREAVDDWENITGQSSTDGGCPCCGQPHHFTLYKDEKIVESGPDARYIAEWA